MKNKQSTQNTHPKYINTKMKRQKPWQKGFIEKLFKPLNKRNS